MKPVCVKCQRFYRPKKNGVAFIEGMPINSDRRPASGTAEPEAWKPYKLWMADLWHCLGCGHELISGAAGKPLGEHWQDDFERKCDDHEPVVQVNDC